MFVHLFFFLLKTPGQNFSELCLYLGTVQLLLKRHQRLVWVKKIVILVLFTEATNVPITHEPLHEKTNNLFFHPGPTQTGLYSHRSRLEA